MGGLYSFIKRETPFNTLFTLNHALRHDYLFLLIYKVIALSYKMQIKGYKLSFT